ncbi:hypothetical protein [Nitrospirillum amazonense]|uniref:hypothetical protein n=1 Tax=Nitrospirillum amazonense TaxID=28077 RepID=UPI0024121E8E|nr:hypothetical protein [Nitrospirillum amazonense]MDG3443718.1 hypothetical protein [Nitrospirillum amazonense]
MNAMKPGRITGTGSVQEIATAFGVASKGDGDDIPPTVAEEPTQLMATPAPHAAWSDDEARRITQAASVCAAAGDIRHANILFARLEAGPTRYFNIDGMERMAGAIARRAAAMAGALPPVTPILLKDLAAFLAPFEVPAEMIPAPVADAVLAAANQMLRQFAAAGFSSHREINSGRAPADLVRFRGRYSGLAGITSRLDHEIRNLLSVSRRGGTAHRPMTLSRRLKLLDETLRDVAKDCGIPEDTWTVESLGLLSEQVRLRWQPVDMAASTVQRFPRHLLEWADQREELPDPRTHTRPTLLQLIQSHPNLEYVEQLRAELAKRFQLEEL